MEKNNDPLKYLNFLSGDNFRMDFIKALEFWFKSGVSDTIIKIIDTIHNAILIHDDIEDGPNKIRDQDSTSIKFGVGMTINSVTYSILKGLEYCYEFNNFKEESRNIVLKDLINLHEEQHLETYWTKNLIIPNKEYEEMILKKTGSLFFMSLSLFLIHSKKDVGMGAPIIFLLKSLINDLSLYYQMCDEYKNLNLTSYFKEKNFAQDMNERKIFFLLLEYSFVASEDEMKKVKEILTKPTKTIEDKNVLVHYFQKDDVFERLFGRIMNTYTNICKTIKDLEKYLGKNKLLETLIENIKFDESKYSPYFPILISTVKSPWKLRRTLIEKTYNENHSDSEIQDFLRKFGEGNTSPVPYDTAWVARVPDAYNSKVPAFPQCLNWLRENQLEDGSWGQMKPFCAHSNAINTLISVIALAQWNDTQDKERIERGVKALWELVEPMKNENYDGIATELLLLSLANEAIDYGLKIPINHYNVFEEIRLKKMKRILVDINRNGFKTPSSWWFSLEILGNKWQKENNGFGFNKEMLGKDFIACFSPAATAYMLREFRIRGIDLPEVEKQLHQIAAKNKHGISHTFCIDLVETYFGLDYLLKAGLSPKGPLLRPHIHRLAKFWDPKSGISASSMIFLPDSDDIAVALRILKLGGYNVTLEPLMSYFNGSFFETYTNELTPSISTNINVVSTLRLFKEDEKVNHVLEKLISWLETETTSEETVFKEEKWHFSTYYCTARAVFSLYGLRDSLVKKCLDFFLRTQNSDGGWGRDGSTAEETANVILAICFCHKNGYFIPIKIFKAANGFLSKAKLIPDENMWRGKVLYSIIGVIQSAVIGAKYALKKILCKMDLKESLADSHQHCLDFSYKVEVAGKEAEINYMMLCLLPKYECFSKVLVGKVVEETLEIIRECGLDFSDITKYIDFYSIRTEKSPNDVLVTFLLYIVFAKLGDVIEHEIIGMGKSPNIIKKMLGIMSNILGGKETSMETITPQNFPHFSFFCRVCFKLQPLLAMYKIPLDEVLKRLEKAGDCAMNENNNNFCILSAKELVSIQVYSGYYAFILSIAYLQKGVIYDSIKYFSLLRKYEDIGLRASKYAHDIITVGTDIRKRAMNNSILIYQNEHNYTFGEAIGAIVNKFNIYISKLLLLKEEMKIIYKDNEMVFRAIDAIDIIVQMGIDYSKNKRYTQVTPTSFQVGFKAYKDIIEQKRME